MADKIYKKVELLLGIDLRSMAVFRILIGSIILYDLGIRASSLKAHYTDLGIISRDVLRGISENPLLLSLNMLDGGLLWQAILFAAAGCSAICLVAGYKTRLSTLICTLLVLSIHVRNPFVNNLGDWYLLNLLFWSSLLPLGGRFSVDASTAVKYKFKQKTVLSIASMGILFQVAALYVFSVFFKISPIWHSEGSAIYYALSLDRLVTPLGELVLLCPDEWLISLTKATILLEKWGPMLAFFPIITVPFRVIAIICFIFFHLGLLLTMELGIFPLVCMAAWILFIPGKIWDLWGREKSTSKEQQFRKDLVTEADGGEKETLNWFETVPALILLWLVLSSNLLYSGKMSLQYYENVYKYVDPLVNSLNLRQRWNMFSPHPSRQDGWFVFAGVKESGEMIDLSKEERKVDWRRPPDISDTYENQRWRKNLEWVMTRWDPHSRYLASYLMRNWNSSHSPDERIHTVYIYFMSEYTGEYHASSLVEKKLLYTE